MHLELKPSVPIAETCSFGIRDEWIGKEGEDLGISRREDIDHFPQHRKPTLVSKRSRVNVRRHVMRPCLQKVVWPDRGPS